MTPLTNPGFIARMKELDNKFSGMKTEMHGVPEKVDPIDWAVFEKSITNKAVFNQIKAEYENIVYPEIKGEDLTKINADLDFSVRRPDRTRVQHCTRCVAGRDLTALPCCCLLLPDREGVWRRRHLR